MEYVFAGVLIYICGVVTGYLLPKGIKTIITEEPCSTEIKHAPMMYDPISHKPRKV